MIDVSDTIIAKSDQLNADDLISGPRTVKVTKVNKVTGDQPLIINYEGDAGKPYKPSKGMRRILVQVWGKDGSKWAGKSMTLVREPTVKWGGAEVGGIWISHVSDLESPLTLTLTVSKQVKKPYRVLPLQQAGEADPAVLKAAQEAAEKGVAEYTKWLGTIDASVKATLRAHHADLTKAAKEADAAKEGQ